MDAFVLFLSYLHVHYSDISFYIWVSIIFADPLLSQGEGHWPKKQSFSIGYFVYFVGSTANLDFDLCLFVSILLYYLQYLSFVCAVVRGFYCLVEYYYSQWIHIYLVYSGSEQFWRRGKYKLSLNDPIV